MRDRDIEFLNYEIVIEIHDFLVDKYGGLPGIRDEALLLSGLSRVEFYYHYKDFEIASLAAVYVFSINAGHLFVDGNKRTSIAAAELFLLINGHELDASLEELEELVLGVANRLIGLNSLCDFFGKRCIPRM